MHRTNFRPLSFIIFSLLMVLTVLLSFATYRSFKSYDQGRFNALVLEIENDISFRMQTYINALEQTRNLFQIEPNLSRKTFREYFEGLNFETQYPGIQGMGYAIKVEPEEIEEFEKRVRHESGINGYHIWPKGDREVYYPIYYLEPMDVLNQRAIGYDMYSEPTRKKAMALARDSGKSVASGKVVLVQEAEPDNPQPGFNIYVPVYSEEDEHLGFIYSPFRAGDLFKGIFSTHPILVDFEVFVEEEATPESLIYNSGMGTEYETSDALFKKESKIRVAEKVWTVRFHSQEEFEKASPYWVIWLILLAGFVISSLIFWVFLNHSKQLLIDQQRVHQLESINQIAKVISAQLNMEKLVKAVTDAGLHLSHAHSGAFFHNSPTGEGLLQVYAANDKNHSELSTIQVPVNAPLFDLTFKEKTTVRSDDVVLHPLYAHHSTIYEFLGKDEGVRSYLAVPVVLRTGEVLGSLIYVSPHPGVFTQKEQAVIESIAAQAAVAMDNARLFLKAREAIRVRDEFFSIASHELKTPLTSLKLQIQSMLRQFYKKGAASFTEDKVSQMGELADKQISRLTALVDDLLDISRISSGRLNLNMEMVDVSSLIDEVVARMEPTLRENQIDMEVEGPRNVEGKFDRLRIEQVLINLISNAIKYGENRPIKLRFFEDDLELHIQVEDQGVGISDEDQRRIFDRFERVLSGARVGGLGLGLYITKQIIEAHGGSISVSSEMGKGSQFNVRLPLDAISSELT